MATNTEPQWYQDLMAKDNKMYGDTYEFHNPEPNNIVLHSGGSEMLRVSQEGFYVRGVRVPQDDREAAAVYECFKEWLTWSQLNR